MCSYCGENPTTKDHVPSKILLDDPFPENLPIVPCCYDCNQDFSFDELYVACIIECIKCGTTNIDDLKRDKIKKALKKRESLHKKIIDSMSESEGQTVFSIEVNRLKNLILKLARGHAKYENSEPIFIEPAHLGFKPLHLMGQDEINLFMADAEIMKAPEVGSRAMQSFLFDNENNILSDWKIVQKNNYSYSVAIGLGTVSVKIIILDYLAAEIIWENE
jgi:hypothetical protein